MSTADDGRTPFDQTKGHAPGQTGVVQYERDGVWVVVAHGTYDMDSIAPFAEALETAASKHTRVVVDAAGIAFADSTFLNLLLHINRLTQLRLVTPAAQLMRVLELTGADTVLDIRASVDDAVT
ncbi:anti-anti-sigma factor [Streptomyces achromogenes]|uniref:Anti-anti-sigma factor n=1 Tax=Streptomyces achromogenes TaxID=67255 RepID=A0ABU0PZ19_STRAH|nr:STAS domain-containing protein [Streptomyces achromogenes]MDQ0683661.1 anti-anti-sigma factor [Streptomyces achromogenes]